MTLKTLQSEMVAAMKSGDKFRKGVISTVIAQIKNMAIDKGCREDIPDTLVDEALLKAKKTTQEMIDTCPDTRSDLLELYKKQMEVISEFAPKMITDEAEIKLMILDLVNSEMAFTKENRGKIMKIIAPVCKGKADMGVVNKVLGEMLK